MKRLIVILILASTISYGQRLDVAKISYLTALRAVNKIQEVDSMLTVNGFDRERTKRNDLIYRNYESDVVSVSYVVETNKYIVNLFTDDINYFKSLVNEVLNGPFVFIERTEDYQTYRAKNGVIQFGYQNNKFFITRIGDPPQY